MVPAVTHLAPAFVPRTVCMQCRRPESVCYCRHVRPVDTKTRVVLLQHPRERDVAIGTARMASLCLTNAELEVGVHWSGSSALKRALSDPERPAALLYPGAGAIDVTTDPPKGPVTLIVVDGTWWQAKKIVRENPELAALPRYSFVPPTPSDYRIRKEPDEAYVSTIEALVYVLGALEGDAEKFQALLTPFRAMIDAQIDCEKRFRNARSRHWKTVRKVKRPHVPPAMRDRFEDLVCVVGEANAWPYRCKERSHDYPDELVHWVAHRVSTGETFEAIATPRNPVAPRTTSYVGLTEESLTRGTSLEELFAKWRAFIRDSDVICSWGRYGTSLFLEEGGTLPDTRIDLRQAARVLTGKKVGTLDEYFASIEAPMLPAFAAGRGGARLRQIVDITNRFVRIANEPLAMEPASGVEP